MIFWLTLNRVKHFSEKSRIAKRYFLVAIVMPLGEKGQVVLLVITSILLCNLK